MNPDDEERIVMTPKKKTSNSTVLMMERKIIEAQPDASGGKVHIAGGRNKGIVVNKQQSEDFDLGEPQVSLQFRVFLVNTSTKKYTQEKRDLSFWFKAMFDDKDRAYVAQEFFRCLIDPKDFPRDYVGFIKKIMKLMQREFPMICNLEVRLTQEKEMNELPNVPSEAEKRKEAETNTEQVLHAIEEAYPNSLTVDDMSRRFKVKVELVKRLLVDLVDSKLVKRVGVDGVEDVDTGATAYRRVHHNEDQVTVVRNLPRVETAMQPTIAIITSQYHEKMAVDAMLKNKQTFVRYATVGEANVYTLGDLGMHRVVATKLPMTGHSRDALIATGSTTTRLLGTFQGVEHVFMVGVGGAVPHFTDFEQHVRLGDVVISAVPSTAKRYIYQYCENVTTKPNGDLNFECRSWCPPDESLQRLAHSIIEKYEHNLSDAPWIAYYNEAAVELRQVGGDWARPPPGTDKLYMSVGHGDLIEVGHPLPKEGREDPRAYGEPMLHMGPIAASRTIASDDQLRQEFAKIQGIKAFDTELDGVVDSIYGSRKDQYMVIRGITDYRDGTKEKEWQQYSALMAAAVLKTIVEDLPLLAN